MDKAHIKLQDQNDEKNIPMHEPSHRDDERVYAPLTLQPALQTSTTRHGQWMEGLMKGIMLKSDMGPGAKTTFTSPADLNRQASWRPPVAQGVEKPLFLRTGKVLVRFRPADLVSVTADGHHVDVQLGDRQHRVHCSLFLMVETMALHGLVMVNRYTAVNVHRITRLSYETVELDRVHVTITSRYRENLLASLRIIG